jgi:hypothetical protein
MNAFGIKFTASRRRRYWHKPWWDKKHHQHKGYWSYNR